MQIAHHLNELWTKNKKGSFLWNTVYKCEALIIGGQEAKPPEAETLLAFGCSLKVANLPTFEKIWNAKNQIQFVLSFPKMTSIYAAIRHTPQITVQ